jgi:hypothetical protein
MGCVSLPDHDKPFRVLVGEGAQEYSFDDAEDGRVCANAEGQGDDGYQGKSARPC